MLGLSLLLLKLLVAVAAAVELVCWPKRANENNLFWWPRDWKVRNGWPRRAPKPGLAKVAGEINLNMLWWQYLCVASEIVSLDFAVTRHWAGRRRQSRQRKIQRCQNGNEKGNAAIASRPGRQYAPGLSVSYLLGRLGLLEGRGRS